MSFKKNKQRKNNTITPRLRQRLKLFWSAISPESGHYLGRAMSHPLMTVRDSLALSLVWVAFMLLVGTIHEFGLSGKIAISVFAIFVLVCCILLMYGFVHKLVNLQNNLSNTNTKDRVDKPTTIIGLQTLISLALPLSLFNITLSYLINTFRKIPNYDTWICDLRWNFVRFYFRTDIAEFLNVVVVILISIGLFVLIAGPVFVKHQQK